MNSVFQAFSKSGKGDGGRSKLSNGKKASPNDPMSYEAIRHAREIAYGSKMSDFVPTNGDASDSEDENTHGVAKFTPTPIQSPVMAIKHDILGMDYAATQPETLPSKLVGATDDVDSNNPKVTLNGYLTNGHNGDSNNCELPKSGVHEVAVVVPHLSNGDTSDTSGNVLLGLPKLEHQNHKLNVSSGSVSSSDGSSSHKDDCSSFINSVKNNRSEIGGFGSRFLKPRLSLSSVGSGAVGNGTVVGASNNGASMPSVHKRSNGAISSPANGANGSAPPTRTRLSTHQRNLSLDFR